MRGLILAVVFAWLASSLSFHTSALRGMRLALNFSVIAAAVTFTTRGFSPSSRSRGMAASIA